MVTLRLRLRVVAVRVVRDHTGLSFCCRHRGHAGGVHRSWAALSASPRKMEIEMRASLLSASSRLPVLGLRSIEGTGAQRLRIVLSTRSICDCASGGTLHRRTPSDHIATKECLRSRQSSHRPCRSYLRPKVWAPARLWCVCYKVSIEFRNPQHRVKT